MAAAICLENALSNIYVLDCALTKGKWRFINLCSKSSQTDAFRRIIAIKAQLVK